MRLHAFLVTTFLLMTWVGMSGQVRDTTSITIRGQLRDEMDQPIPNAIVINRTTKRGSFGKPNGSFELKCQRGDTLAITSTSTRAPT
jgi:hypothetical protein